MNITDLPSFQAAPSDGDTSSVFGAAARGAISMIPVGEQGYAEAANLLNHSSYLGERQKLHQQIQQDIDTQPEARLAGQVAGVAAPIIATAGVAAPETLLGAAGQGAVFGGLTGAGNAIDTLASGGSGAQAAGDVALGAGVGALGGAAGQAVGNALGKASSAVLPTADELSAHATANALGGTTRQIKSLPGKNPVQTLNAMRDVINSSSVEGEPLISMGEHMNDRLNKFVNLQKQSGQTIGDTIKQAGTQIESVPAQPIIDGISSSMKFPSPDEAAQVQSVINTVKSYADKDGNLPFARLQQLKSDLGDEAFHGAGNPVLQNAYHVVNDVQDAHLDKVSDLIDKPAFTAAKQQYQMTSRALPMLKTAVSKEAANKASLTVPGAALVTGHPIAAAGALLKPRLEQMANAAAFHMTGPASAATGNALSRIPSMAGASAASSQVPENKAVTDLHLQHPAMAPWRQTFAQNAAKAKDAGEISKANAVTDFTLSQRDPAYAAAKQKVSDNPEATEQPEQSAQEPTKMAEGGIVADLKDNFGKPVPGFTSTLPGLQNIADVIEGNGLSPVPTESNTPVRQSAPVDKFHQPFNPQFEEQLRAYLMKPKEDENAD